MSKPPKQISQLIQQVGKNLLGQEGKPLNRTSDSEYGRHVHIDYFREKLLKLAERVI